MEAPIMAPATKAGPAGILVVDDRPDGRTAVSAVLEELGERIVTASSGQEALQRSLEEEFAVVLLDVRMPEMDGFETAA
ncbi:MAG TPA: response regulator, partial [Planctomycetota bacterium]|nr:response regulator [Planctomycetota bacterium]